MSNQIAHFAINADDLERAQRFYGEVFGWTFHPWGPPGFCRVDTGQGGLGGAMQTRRTLGDKPIHGFECTIAVEDVDAAVAAIERAGGRIVMDKATIAGVGHLVFFEDSEGNVAGAMQYDASAQ